MKNILGFEDFVNESNQHLHEAEETTKDYIYKEDTGGGKPTWTLRLTKSGWDKVKHLFDKEGRPTKELTRIPAQKSVWNLYAQTYPGNDSQIMYRIYGVSGDWTFGNAPTFYQQKWRGNKKAAKEVFDWFIKNYLD